MIEAGMYFALGLLAAGLVVLLIGPPLWRRAVRLNHGAIERTLPMTLVEINADKDQLRASFAVEVRRLEATIEKLEARTLEQRIDLDRRREVIARLTASGAASAEELIRLGKQRDEFLATLADRDRSLAEAGEAMAAGERRFHEIDGRLVEARTAIAEMAAAREAQRSELKKRDEELEQLRASIVVTKATSGAGEIAGVGMEDEAGALKEQLASFSQKLAASEGERSALDAKFEAAETALEEARAELAAANARNEALAIRLLGAETSGVGLLATQETKGELDIRIAELEAANGRLEAELAELRSASALSGGNDATLRGKLIEIGNVVARLAAEKPVTAAPSAAGTAAALPVNGAAANGNVAHDADPAPPVLTPISLAERIRSLQQAGG